MERAGCEDMPEDAERKGLGTPATRAGILEKLVSTGLVERVKKEKKTVLVPTPLGNSLITVLPEQLQSPLLTAEWEQQLSGVQKGVCLPDDFLDGICAMLTELIQSYRPVAGADILFPSDEKVIGKCPRCGSKIVERSKGYFCTNRDCKFVLWRDSRFFTLKQKTLDRKTAVKLFLLVPDHLRQLPLDTFKLVCAHRDRPQGSAPQAGQVDKGQLEGNRAVEVVEKIAPRLLVLNRQKQSSTV